MKAADSFYKSARWQRLRAMVLRRDGYQCQVSKRYGKRVEATTVHHVFPREEFPEYQWEPWNLISLAGDVHDEMHDRQSGALTEKGVELLKRVARKYGVEIPGYYR
jgi:5-methylcytosine-specific restriction endonuclease McrA